MNTRQGRSDSSDADATYLEWHRWVEEGLREELLQHWVRVTNVGGAVGFVPPITRDVCVGRNRPRARQG